MKLELVENEEKYWDFIRVLRTHPENISGFLEQVEITKEQQIEYMKKHAHEYLVCIEYLDGIDWTVPVGWIGIVDHDIRLCVDPLYRGNGIGKFMLSELDKHMSTNLARAKVKLNNIASQKVFESCGYKLYREDENFKYYYFPDQTLLSDLSWIDAYFKNKLNDT